jgi:hypothetical protein
MPIVTPIPSTNGNETSVNLDPLTERLTAAETAIAAIQPYDDTPIDTRLDALERHDWIKPIYTPPLPVHTFSLSGVTLTTDIGTLFVDEGRVHTLARMTGAILANSWQNTLTIPKALGNCEVRFATHESVTATTIRVRVSTEDNDYLINRTLTQPNWTVLVGNITAYVDGEWTWFRVPVNPTTTDIQVRLNLPVGKGQIPCVYASDSPITTATLVLNSLELVAENGSKMTYRPVTVPDMSGYALKSEIPASPNLSGYALKTEIPASPDLSGYATRGEMSTADAALQTAINNLRMDTDANTAAIVEQMDSSSGVSPTLTNYPVNKNISTYYTPTTSGVTRIGGVSRPPANVTDFCMYDSNWDSTLELPVPAVAGQSLNVRNEATLAVSLLASNTNMSGAIDILTNRSLHFISNADLVWHWIPAPFLTTRHLLAKMTSVNAGVVVNFGTISMQMPTSGNRSMQVRANTSTNISIMRRSIYDGGGESLTSSQTLTNSAWSYIASGWNFTSAGNWQETFIRDDSNRRMYVVTMVVGSNYDNNWFNCIELPYSY